MLGSITSKILRHNAKVSADRGLRFHNFAFKGAISSCKSRQLPNMTPARLLRFGALTGLGLVSTGYPLLADGRGSTSGSNILSNINNYQLSDAAGAVTFGAVSGFFTGFVVKKIGTAALFFVGTVGIVFQLAASGGYIEIRWDKIEKRTKEILDEAQKEADNIDLKNPDVFINKKLAPMILGHVAPTGGGFAAGFFLGCRF